MDVGLNSARGLLCIEEIKTLRVEVEDIPEGVLDSYWHQAQLYGYIARHSHWCRPGHLEALPLPSGQKRRKRSLSGLATSRNWRQYSSIRWVFFPPSLAGDKNGIAARNASMRDLAFPYGRFQVGPEGSWRCLSTAQLPTNRQLIIEAPTGIGKTMATLYPSIKAMESSGYEPDVLSVSKDLDPGACSDCAEGPYRCRGQPEVYRYYCKGENLFQPGATLPP